MTGPGRVFGSGAKPRLGDIQAMGTPPRGRGAGGAGGAVALPSPVILPPDVSPIPGATYFYAQGSATVAGPAASWTVPAGIITQLPSNAIGVVNFIEVLVNNLTTSSQITFGLRVNGGGVAGFGAVTLTPQAANSVVLDLTPLVVRVPLGAVLDILATVTDAGTYLMGATYYGWYWTHDQALAYATGQGDWS